MQQSIAPGQIRSRHWRLIWAVFALIALVISPFAFSANAAELAPEASATLDKDVELTLEKLSDGDSEPIAAIVANSNDRAPVDALNAEFEDIDTQISQWEMEFLSYMKAGTEVNCRGPRDQRSLARVVDRQDDFAATVDW